jgi:hypothetical protein
VIAAKAGENPLFKKVLDSQKAFAQRAGQWQNDYMVDFKMAWNHYFRAPARRPDRATPRTRATAASRGRWPAAGMFAARRFPRTAHARACCCRGPPVDLAGPALRLADRALT